MDIPEIAFAILETLDYKSVVACLIASKIFHVYSGTELAKRKNEFIEKENIFLLNEPHLIKDCPVEIIGYFYHNYFDKFRVNKYNGHIKALQININSFEEAIIKYDRVDCLKCMLSKRGDEIPLDYIMFIALEYFSQNIIKFLIKNGVRIRLLYNVKSQEGDFKFVSVVLKNMGFDALFSGGDSKFGYFYDIRTNGAVCGREDSIMWFALRHPMVKERFEFAINRIKNTTSYARTSEG